MNADIPQKTYLGNISERVATTRTLYSSPKNIIKNKQERYFSLGHGIYNSWSKFWIQNPDTAPYLKSRSVISVMTSRKGQNWPQHMTIENMLFAWELFIQLAQDFRLAINWQIEKVRITWLSFRIYSKIYTVWTFWLIHVFGIKTHTKIGTGGAIVHV